MNKARVDRWIPLAADALRSTGVVQQEKIHPSFRRQISTFGSAVAGGSLRAALLFFSQDGRAMVQRSKLVESMFWMLRKDEPGFPADIKELLERGEPDHRTQEKFLDAAIAIKLAISLFEPDKTVRIPTNQSRHPQQAYGTRPYHRPYGDRDDRGHRPEGQRDKPFRKPYQSQSGAEKRDPKGDGSHA